MISSATWMPCSRSSSAAACVIALTPNAPAAQRPAPGGGAARRAAGRLNHGCGRSLVEQERAGSGEEGKGGAGRGGGPRIERLGRRARDRSTAERAAAVAAVGCCRVEDEIDGAVRRSGLLEHRATLAWSVTSPRTARAPAAVMPASVSSERATPVTAQPSARSSSIARPAEIACSEDDRVPGDERVAHVSQYPGPAQLHAGSSVRVGRRAGLDPPRELVRMATPDAPVGTSSRLRHEGDLLRETPRHGVPAPSDGSVPAVA